MLRVVLTNYTIYTDTDTAADTSTVNNMKDTITCITCVNTHIIFFHQAASTTNKQWLLILLTFQMCNILLHMNI